MTQTKPPQPRVTPSAANESSEYVLGTGSDELARLGLQHQLWSAAAHELWERASVAQGSHVLDIGCGPGHAAMDLAQIVGETGLVIGIDESARFLKALHDEAASRKLQNVQRVLGDVQDIARVLPDYAASIDVAYARWVFCFLSRPEDVVAGVARLLKPGGRLAIQDYFNYEFSMALAPRRESFHKVVSAVASSWRARGGDPDIVGRLPALLAKHGLKVTHLAARSRIARPGEMMWSWPETFFLGFTTRLVESGHLAQEDAARFRQDWAEASSDRSNFCLLPTVFDLIAIKL
ncbi:MAG: methyltransferase domain-containing protein [Phycisphaerae bacterium]|nr:methyltransferase domain-containing protein [Phycisphaerae bacterium]